MKTPIKEKHSFGCANFLKTKIPKGSVINSFLFYDGGLEFQLSSADRFVIGTTNKYVIYEFWHCAFKDPERVMKSAQFFHKEMVPHMAHMMQQGWAGYKDPYVRAALFFLLNRYSDMASPSRGHINLDSYNPIATARFKSLPNLQNFFLNFHHDEDYIVAMEETQPADYFLFPVGPFSYNLFQHGKSHGYEDVTINHSELREYLTSLSDQKAMAIYHNHAALSKFYKDFNLHYLDAYGRPTDTRRDAKEVIVANF
jgi:hypothetical protein